ncbi:uncharacterized protein LOC131618914 [Vicia villosa]|uniref:uncharacterized protein LOC131618914 n=1 Tax=Vicia villosa TaxID=3911 RepID=UPI00273BB7A6|nr:uncharacterized protein LOC131618914 [Vicia villosa]
MAKLREISSRLLELNDDINVLVEIRVKFGRATSVRNNLNIRGKLEQRKQLWQDLKNLHQLGPWCLIGDFNNVLKAQDRIRGKLVFEAEYHDLQVFMDNNQLFEMGSNGDYFTWSNKHLVDTIYSRIDRLIANPD